MGKDIFERLAQSEFRRRFKLSEKDIAYIKAKGLENIKKHAEDFIKKRIAPASIKNDGKQTPMKTILFLLRSTLQLHAAVVVYINGTVLLKVKNFRMMNRLILLI